MRLPLGSLLFIILYTYTIFVIGHNSSRIPNKYIFYNVIMLCHACPNLSSIFISLFLFISHVNMIVEKNTA